MHGNLTTYFMAEQINRARLPRQAERSRLAQEAASLHRAPRRAASLQRAIGGALIRIGMHLQQMGSVAPLAAPDRAHSRP